MGFNTVALMDIQQLFSIITAGVGAATAIIVFIVRFSKPFKMRRLKRNQRNEIIDSLPERLSKIEDSQEDLHNNLNELRDAHENFESRFDQFETKELKYMINDSFLGYGSVRDIPDEQLYNAAECCDIYIGKGLNHETGAKCKIIYHEIDRREQIKSEGDKHE